MKIPGRSYGGVPQLGSVRDDKRIQEKEQRPEQAAGRVVISEQARALDLAALKGEEVRQELVREAKEMIATGELETDAHIEQAVDALIFDLL